MHKFEWSSRRDDGFRRLRRAGQWHRTRLTSRLNEGPVNNNSSLPMFSVHMHQLPEHRKQLIFRIRRQIAENTYDTPDKLRIALERMFDEMPWSDRQIDRKGE